MYSQQSNKRSLPEINTSSLPDIIFMLLFFFMIVTVIKKEESESEVQIPSVDYAEYISEKDLESIIISYEGTSVNYHTGGQQFAQLKDLKKAMTKQLASLRLSRIKLVAQRTIPMSDINEVKSMLQDMELYEVDYLVVER